MGGLEAIDLGRIVYIPTRSIVFYGNALDARSWYTTRLCGSLWAPQPNGSMASKRHAYRSCINLTANLWPREWYTVTYCSTAELLMPEATNNKLPFPSFRRLEDRQSHNARKNFDLDLIAFSHTRMMSKDPRTWLRGLYFTPINFRLSLKVQLA